MRQLKQMFWVKGAIEQERKRHKHLVCVTLFDEATKTSSVVCVLINSPQSGASFYQIKFCKILYNTNLHTEDAQLPNFLHQL